MDDAEPTGSNCRYRCGAVEIDASQRRVLLDGVPAKLGARAFDVLLALVERRDRLVPKRELMDVVWPKLVVEENNLLVHMVALRKLLGPQAISTIPGRGYRFTMPVEAVADAESAHGVPAVAVSRADAVALAVQGNLPVSPALIGRAQDLDAITVLMLSHPVVSIVGAGGIGKTRLTLAASTLATLEFPGGRWWVELAPVFDGAQVAGSIAGALGRPLPSDRRPDEALAALLAGESLLLVLDGCEHLAESVATVVDLLRAHAPNVRMLLSSQESLKCRDEQVYRLGGLAVPAAAQLEEASQYGAIALFVERAHALEPRFRLSDDNVALVIEICRRLDGIPLAIELAAARVPLLGVRGLHDRLDQMFNVLSGGTRMKLRRHQTLRAALEWSYGLLSTDEQAAFRRLGAFAGGFTLELAQQLICDDRVDRWTALDLLGHLIDKSMVIADGGTEPRYRLLEITRAFALEQLGEVGESAGMLRRHAEVILDLMTAVDEKCWDLSPAERMRAVAELSNLRAAVDWALSAGGDRLLAYRLLSRCWLTWMHNGLIREGVQRMVRLLPVPADLPPRIEADFCLALARMHEDAGRDEEWQSAQRAETLYRQLDDADRLGDALLLKATIAMDRGLNEEAGRALRESEGLVNQSTALRKQAALAATQGMYCKLTGATDGAIKAFCRQRDLYRRAGAALGEYLALGNIGSAQLEAGEVDPAIDSLRKSVDGLGRMNSRYGLEWRLSKLAIALALKGSHDDTLPLARNAFEHLRTLDASFGPMMAAALEHAHRGDMRRAVLLAGRANVVLKGQRTVICPADLQLQQRVRALAVAASDARTVEAWFESGEQLTEEQAAAIAFDQAPLDSLA